MSGAWRHQCVVKNQDDQNIDPTGPIVNQKVFTVMIRIFYRYAERLFAPGNIPFMAMIKMIKVKTKSITDNPATTI